MYLFFVASYIVDGGHYLYDQVEIVTIVVSIFAYLNWRMYWISERHHHFHLVLIGQIWKKSRDVIYNTSINNECEIEDCQFESQYLLIYLSI